MNKIEVVHAWSDSGNCREYYRTKPSGQLICLQDEGGAGGVWYTVIDDGCWYEPNSVIDTDKYTIEIVSE